MAKYTGFVKRVGVKNSPPGARRAWTLYSVLLEKEDGSEHPWVSLGFKDEPPAIKEGDYLALEANTDDANRLVAVAGTITKPKNPPARAAKPAAQSSGGGGFRKGNGGGGGYSQNKFDGTGIQNKSNPEDVKRMSYANARTTAVDLVALLLLNKALPITASQGKAGEQKRFDEIKAAVDKITVEFYNDGVSLRKTLTVADAGVVNVAPDGPLPTETKSHDIDQEDQGNEDAPAEEESNDDVVG